MLRDTIVKHPLVKAALPTGTQRRAIAAELLDRVWPAPKRPAKATPKATAKPKSTAPATPRKPKPLNKRAEEAKLKDSWTHLEEDILGRYLVTGWQDPRINVQSILARHTLVRALFGSEFDDIMAEELPWAVECNETVRLRARELGVKVKTTTNPDRLEILEKVFEVIAPRVNQFEERWKEALSGREAPRLSVLEYACGSANDYRALDAYGIAQFLDYTGVDLNEGNIANALRMFPEVNFRCGSILSLPEEDRSVDYVIGFDIMEHLSLAAMQLAFDSAIRICRRGMHFAFFRMDEVAEHDERPTRDYHRNLISAPLIRQRMEEEFESVELFSIKELLRDEYGCKHTHRPTAYTLNTEGPRHSS